jgi:hypothetical protein
MSNLGFAWRKPWDKTLTIISYLLLDKLNKKRNSVMHYSKNSLPQADNTGKMNSVGYENGGFGFIYSVCFEALGGP